MSFFKKKIQRLFIAEKPEVAKCLVAALANTSKDNAKKYLKDGFYQVGNDAVVAFSGHMIELKEPEDYNPAHKEWRLADLPIINIPWEYKLKEDGGKLKTLALCEKLFNEVGEVVNAGDWDDQGQLLVDIVINYYQYSGHVSRIKITNENNIEEAVEALANMENNDKFKGWSDQALALSIVDQMYGINMSRLFNLQAQNQGYIGRLNIGRVMTVIAWMIVNRDNQRLGHEKVFYYTVTGLFSFNGTEINVPYVPNDEDSLDDKGRISSEEVAKAIASSVEDKPAKVTKIESKISKKNPPLVFSILELQAEASSRFKISSDETLEISQALRDKYDCITYNRSDNQALYESHYQDAPRLVSELAKFDGWTFSEVAQSADTSIRSKTFLSADSEENAHHGIIPKVPVDPEKLTTKERQIYELIVATYLAQFYPPEEKETKTIHIECADRHFSGRRSEVVSPGWTTVFKEDSEEDEATEEDVSCPFEGLDNSEGTCISGSVKNQVTKPPKPYTEATLLKDLKQVSKFCEPNIKALLLKRDENKPPAEKGGIGTPATRDSMLAKIIDNGWATRSDKMVFESTKAGRDYIALLPPEITRPDLTAMWFERQLDVQNGELSVLEFVQEVADFIRDEVVRVTTDGLNVEVHTEPCDQEGCNGTMRMLPGKNGPFFGCSNFNESCKNTWPAKDGLPDKKAARRQARSSSRGSRSSSRRTRRAR